MQPKTRGAAISASTAPSTARGNAERCKHDLLPGQCGFCQVSSSELAERVTSRELVAWLGGFARPSESARPEQRTNHESPQPGASAGSTANPAISRRWQ